MARFDYTRLRNTAIRLIDRFGDDATLLKPGTKTGPDYDPTAGPASPSGIVLLEVDWQTMYRDQSKVKANDKFWMVSTVGLDPEIENSITYPVTNGQTYSIENIVTLKPGPTAMYFIVQARR